MDGNDFFSMDALRRRYSAPVEKLDSNYKSGFSQQKYEAFHHGFRSPSFLLTKVAENEELETEDPFEEFHQSPENRIIKAVNNLGWKVDGSGRNRAQSLIDGFIDEVDPDLNQMKHALLSIHRLRRRNRRQWSIFDETDKVRFYIIFHCCFAPN